MVLRNGLIVPYAALALAWRLEALGCELEADGDRLILDRPEPDPLTDADREDIRRWRRHLAAIVSYVDDGGYLQ